MRLKFEKNVIYCPALELVCLSTLMEKSEAKDQIKPKADYRAVDSPKNRTNQFVFVFLLYSPEILET